MTLGFSPPAGWKLLPIRPTREMIDAADASDRRYTDRTFGAGHSVWQQGGEDHYAAMVGAAPAAPLLTFNLNDRYAVVLTAEGAAVMEKWYLQFPAKYRKAVTTGMTLVEPLWHLMQMFGPALHMAGPPLFENNNLELREQG